MRRLFALALLLLAAVPASALEPLKQAGSEALYQRVLTRPGAEIRAAPEAGASLVEIPPPFAVLYVFARKEAAGTTWLAVGAPFAGPPLGWIKAEQTVAWSQQLLLAFTNPAYRLRNLFFAEREGALRFLEDENVVDNAKRALVEADAGGDPGAGAIVSAEPKAFVDINESFYLLPILESEEYLLGGVFPGNLVKVASLPLDQPAADPTAEALAQFNAAIVFVIDTTISMEPYIERTKEAIRRFTEEIAGSPLGERVSFGVVAFRGNTDVAPAVEYVSRVILEPSWPPKPGQLEAALGQLEAATASTQGFIEDGMAGMQAALELPQWDAFGGRFIIYISDTAALDSANPLASTGKNPAEINALARERQIATLVLMLKTAAGAAYHGLAEQQYKALAAWEGLQPLYFPIPEGDVGAFGEAVDQATQQVIAIVEQSIRGQLVEPPAAPEPITVAGSTRLVGRAMQLAWLGRSSGVTAPDLFEAWAYDRALDDPNRQSFEVRVLLNRNQINDLTLRLEALLDAAGQSQTGSRDFFQQLRSTMAQFVTDPQRLAAADRIGDFLAEYLAALPYKSQVLSIDQATWTSLGPAAQDEILSGIRSKLAAYKLIYEDVGRWTALWEGAPAAELVYPVPLSLLP
jgi:serine/threonine-protein kinase PpkA